MLERQTLHSKPPHTGSSSLKFSREWLNCKIKQASVFPIVVHLSVFSVVRWEQYVGIEIVSYVKAFAIVFPLLPESIPNTMGSALAAVMNQLCFSGIWMSLIRWVRRPCRLWCLSLPLNTSHESLECWNRTMDTPFLLVSTARINLCNCFSN